LFGVWLLFGFWLRSQKREKGRGEGRGKNERLAQLAAEAISASLLPLGIAMILSSGIVPMEARWKKEFEGSRSEYIANVKITCSSYPKYLC
jgi:hypothetical protein